MSIFQTGYRAIHTSKILTPTQKLLHDELCYNANAAGACVKTNAELAKALNISEDSVISGLATLKKYKLISVIFNSHLHKRWIYPRYPGEPPLEDEPWPTEDEPSEQMQNMKEAMKRAITLGDVSIETLVNKLKESGYLDKVDCENQFILNPKQLRFLILFKEFYPEKRLDCQVAAYDDVNFDELFNAVKKSDFLKDSDNLSIKWLLDNAADIIAGKYENFGRARQNFTSRNYTRAELNAGFQNIDDIEV